MTDEQVAARIMELMADDDANDSNGQQSARLFALLYSELRSLAQSQLRGERVGHTLNATALVNEAYLKLTGGTERATSTHTPMDRGRFFAAAASAMRRILVDHARTRGRQKRGGNRSIIGSAAITDVPNALDGLPLDTLVLDEALTRLAVEHAAAAKVVEMRFFGGLSEEVIAEGMGISERTVRRHWTFAKAWLGRDLADAD